MSANATDVALRGYFWPLVFLIGSCLLGAVVGLWGSEPEPLAPASPGSAPPPPAREPSPARRPLELEQAQSPAPPPSQAAPSPAPGELAPVPSPGAAGDGEPLRSVKQQIVALLEAYESNGQTRLEFGVRTSQARRKSLDALLKELRAFGPPAVRPLIELVSESTGIRRRIVALALAGLDLPLAQRGAWELIEADLGLRAQLLPALPETQGTLDELRARYDAHQTDPDPRLRLDLLHELVRRSGADRELSAEVLSDVARADPSRAVRASAVTLLGQRGRAEQDTDLLHELLVNDPELEVRQRAAVALAELSPTRAVGVLGELARDPAEAALEVRAAAVIGLGRVTSEPALAELEALAEDSALDASLRQRARAMSQQVRRRLEDQERESQGADPPAPPETPPQ